MHHYFVPLSYSLFLLWCQQHLCLPCYPKWQQLCIQIYNFNEKALNISSRWGGACSLVRLTFSPIGPLSPAVPGSVKPGGPCINQNQESAVSCIRKCCSIASLHAAATSTLMAIGVTHPLSFGSRRSSHSLCTEYRRRRKITVITCTARCGLLFIKRCQRVPKSFGIKYHISLIIFASSSRRLRAWMSSGRTANKCTLTV